MDERILYNKEFDMKFKYDGKDLGAVWSKDKTVFKVWSPNAEKVMVRLYTRCDNAKDKIPMLKVCRDMEQCECGVFVCEIPGDLHGIYYDYEIIRQEKHIVTADPYAIGCGCNGTLSMVTDLKRTDPEGFELDQAPKLQTEQIIYELHMKDFSMDPDSNIPEEYRGKFKAFTVNDSENGRKSPVTYLKELGVTHVHLLPFFDFAVVDEAGDSKQFNWGYDPLNYNVPEGSYSTDPYDGCVRIRECKEMIQALHRAGMRVVMDVVYNHTYSADSWLERMVPGYYCRRWEDGTLCNGSGCGSDMAVGRAMVDNYIADSVMHWAREYHVDGFRFDLMGLLTVELMNRIRKEMDAAFGKNEILLYGEPWRADTSAMEKGTRPALKSELQYLNKGIAVFSDDTRDTIKGHVFDAQKPGFVNGGEKLEGKILQGVSAWRKGGSIAKPKSASQIINYVSAHDNLTLWDKLIISMNKDSMKEGRQVYDDRHRDVLAANKLAALINFTCQGYVFFQAGEEFGRTKYGDENSYRSDVDINMLKWKRVEEFNDLVDYYKGLIRLRKKAPGLYDKSADAYKRITDEQIHGKKLVSFQIDNRAVKDPVQKSEYDQLMVIYNASDHMGNIKVPDGEWFVLADQIQTDCCYPAKISEDGKIKVESHSGMILGKK